MQIQNSMMQQKLSTVNNNQAENQAQRLSRIRDDKKLKEACSEFESLFLNQMFKQMRKTVKFGKESLIDGGMAENIFKDMLFEKYSQNAAKTHSIGIGKIAYDFLKENSTPGAIK
jgi:flagellar protein FlgJ